MARSYESPVPDFVSPDPVAPGIVLNSYYENPSFVPAAPDISPRLLDQVPPGHAVGCLPIYFNDQDPARTWVLHPDPWPVVHLEQGILSQLLPGGVESWVLRGSGLAVSLPRGSKLLTLTELPRPETQEGWRPRSTCYRFVDGSEYEGYLLMWPD